MIPLEVKYRKYYFTIIKYNIIIFKFIEIYNIGIKALSADDVPHESVRQCRSTLPTYFRYICTFSLGGILRNSCKFKPIS